tara:strand:+ start:23541 stop:24206 length:666 start_codon:yes stop_codon:yes gene_type:complete
MCREFDAFASFFSLQGDRPLIVDAGSNIGISVLEWKSRWPQCEVICFEPDPFAFELLTKNIEHNGLPSVTYHNLALSDHEGPGTFHGSIDRNADARGNSLSEGWGRRDGSGTIDVDCARLSTFLGEREVSFLKLDVEGSEEKVLRELGDRLGQIAAMYVEVHETNETSEHNSSVRIVALLKEAGFVVEDESRHSPHALPAHLDSWRRRVGARQTQLLCWRQ